MNLADESRLRRVPDSLSKSPFLSAARVFQPGDSADQKLILLVSFVSARLAVYSCLVFGMETPGLCGFVFFAEHKIERELIFSGAVLDDGQARFRNGCDPEYFQF